MDEQRKLTEFESDPSAAPDEYDCAICGQLFDSAKARGAHRRAHEESELRTAMVDELQRLADELDRVPSQRTTTEHARFSAKAYQNRFGSWNDALRAAGLEVNKRGQVGHAELLDELHRLHDVIGNTPTSRDMERRGCYSPSLYSRKFDSWNAAIRRAGLEVTEQRDIPQSDLVHELERLSEKLGRLPTAGEMEHKGEFSVNTYVREFGSWNDALADVFGKINRQRDVPKSELLDELDRIGESRVNPPTAVEVADADSYAVSTFTGTFGTWNDALRAAGYEPTEQQNIPPADLIDELHRLSEEMEQTPTALDMERSGDFGWTTYREKFGSWNEALRAADLDINVSSDIPETDLLTELRRLRDELGHDPGRREMDQHGEYDSTTYMSTFGSWNVALVAAGLEPNKVLHPDHLAHPVRSRWELEIADLLLEANVSYDYEAMTIEYGNEREYTPDFITVDYVIEVKGDIYSNEHEKAVAARNALSDRDYVVVGTALPADIHIPWEARHDLSALFS